MFRKIKKWYKLAETNKGLIILHILFTIIRVVGLIISPIFVAKVTTCLTAGDYAGAWLNLSIEIVIISISLLSWDQVYRNASRLFGDTYRKVQHKIYKKAYRAKESNFQITSKEKLLNIIGTDIDVVCNFADTLGVKLGKIVQVVVTLTIVFTYNWIVGIGILVLSIANFFILLKLNKGIANHKRSMYENKDKIYEDFSKILSSQNVIKEYDMGQSYADKYFDKCEKYIHSFKKNKNLTGVKDCLFVTFYKIVIFAITFLMIFLVKENILSLTLYLVLVSYLLTATELINEIINITASIEEATVSRKRIETVLNFTDAEWIKFGNIVNSSSSQKSLNFINVAYSNSDETSPLCGTLENIDINFIPYSINLIKGARYSGKRLIFGLLTRRIIPTSGKIIMDNINIVDYEQKHYKNRLFSVFGKPLFIEGSIMANFNIIEKNKEVVFEACKKVGVFDFIESLPEKFETSISNSAITPTKQFLISLAMGVAKNSSYLAIYEIPPTLTKKESESLKALLQEISLSKTIIIFTHTNLFDNICSQSFLIEKGLIKKHTTSENK